jgi:hypothetical protein
MEAILNRQKLELEELENKLEVLRSSISSSDKNQKKSFKKKADTMKDELNRKHEQERYDFHVNNDEGSDEELNDKIDDLNIKVLKY